MAVAIRDAFEGRGLIFAAAYVGVHLLRNGALLVSGTYRKTLLPVRMVLWTLASAPLWFIGGILQDGWELVLWAVAIVFDYAGAAIGWPVPLLGRLPPQQWEVGGEHLAERYRQILVIGLGDAILIMGAAWIDTPSTPLRGAILALAFVYTVLLLQSYFRVAGERLADMLSRSGNKGRAAQLTSDCHLLMVLGIVISSVGIDLVIRHPLEHPEGIWAVVIIVGPAMFMLGRILFGRLVLGRLSPVRVITMIGLLAITPIAQVVRPVYDAVAVTAVLAIVQLPRISKRFARWIHEPVLGED